MTKKAKKSDKQKARIAELESTVASLRTEVDNLELDLREERKLNSGVDTVKFALEDKVSALETAVVTLSLENVELKRDLKTAEEREDELQDEVHDLQDKLEPVGSGYTYSGFQGN